MSHIELSEQASQCIANGDFQKAYQLLKQAHKSFLQEEMAGNVEKEDRGVGDFLAGQITTIEILITKDADGYGLTPLTEYGEFVLGCEDCEPSDN